MAEITAAMVKDLREKTGAGMMDAKKALNEVGGDMEAAVDWLRKKGLATAAKKSSRTAAEGLVAIAVAGNKAAVVEVNAETDFVARNDQFCSFVDKVSQLSLNAKGDIDALAQAPYEGGKNVKEKLTELIATIGENMSLRRAQTLEVSQGAVVGYVHNAITPTMGKIGVLVALESSADSAKLEVLGKQIAMHVAAANPQFLDTSSVTQEAVDREKSVLREQAKTSGKTDDIIEKMLEGRMRKFYEEICLLEQVFVMDGETKISKVVENAGKELGAPVKLVSYARFQLGEGIEKEVTDFAAEVAAVVNG